MERYGSVIWRMRARDKCMMFAFLRGINEYEKGQTGKKCACVCLCVKHKIEGSTLPHPSNERVTNTQTIPSPYRSHKHAHTDIRERKKGVWNFSLLCAIYTTQLFVLVWFGLVFKNDAYLCDRQ